MDISDGGSISGTNGNYIVRVTRIGEVKLTLSKRDGAVLPYTFTANVKRIPDPTDPNFPPELREKLKNATSGIKYTDGDPKVFIGNLSGGRISLDYLKAQKELQLSPGYSFVSATLYFSFPGEKVNMVSLNSTSLVTIKNIITRCVSGSTIMFDQVYIKDNNGETKRVLNPPGFRIYDDKITDQQGQILKQKLVEDALKKQ